MANFWDRLTSGISTAANNVGNWAKDAVGAGEGKWYQGLGVGDDSGSYSGFFGKDAGSGSFGQSPGAPDYEAAQAAADAKAAAAMQGMYDTVDDLKVRAEDIPTFTEWMDQQGMALNDITGSDEYGGLSDLVSRLEAGPTDEDYDAAMDHAARLMGLSREEADSLMGSLTKQMAGFEDGMTEEELADAGVLDRFSGMTPEEEALRRRQNQSNIRMAEQRAQRMVQDSLADTGSTARMLQTADEATMQINNMQLQQDSMLAQEQFERQVAQFESQKQTWQTMLQTNQIGSQQYIQNMQNSMGMAIQGYAQQINAMVQENQQTLQQYTADRDAMVAQINSLYQAAQLELGVTMAEADLASEYYSAEVQPYFDSLNAQLTEDEMGFDFGTFLGGVGIAVMGYVTGNPGALVSGGSMALGAF